MCVCWGTYSGSERLVLNHYSNKAQTITAKHSNFSEAHLYFFAFQIKSKKQQMGFREVVVIRGELL
jgi:hypothetical protein